MLCVCMSLLLFGFVVTNRVFRGKKDRVSRNGGGIEFKKEARTPRSFVESSIDENAPGYLFIYRNISKKILLLVPDLSLNYKTKDN
jgi:hypothetical protein